MEKVKISLNTIGKIQDFVTVIAKYPGNFYLESGKYKVNACSILGIFNLDLARPVILTMENVTDQELIADVLKKWEC